MKWFSLNYVIKFTCNAIYNRHLLSNGGKPGNGCLIEREFFLNTSARSPKGMNSNTIQGFRPSAERKQIEYILARREHRRKRTSNDPYQRQNILMLKSAHYVHLSFEIVLVRPAGGVLEDFYCDHGARVRIQSELS
jgi:hypothetical protein